MEIGCDHGFDGRDVLSFHREQPTRSQITTALCTNTPKTQANEELQATEQLKDIRSPAHSTLACRKQKKYCDGVGLLRLV